MMFLNPRRLSHYTGYHVALQKILVRRSVFKQESLEEAVEALTKEAVENASVDVHQEREDSNAPPKSERLANR